MKVTFLTYIYPYPERGFNPGIERVIQEFARNLVDKGHEVHVLTTYRNGGSEKHGEDQGVRIHRVSDTRRYLGRVGSLLSLDLLSLNISFKSYSELLETSDVVHAFTPIIHKFFSTKLVSHYHHWDDPSQPLEYLYLPSSHLLWKQCYEISDKVVAVSEYSATDLSERGVDDEKLVVVPNGVDTGKYNPGPSDIEFNEWETVLLYVGPLMDRKGIEYLIQSLPTILDKYPKTGLVIVGGGESDTYEELADSLGVKDNIRFEGFVPDEKLPEYYRGADIFAFPSLLEGFGMVLIEAMASGLPVVSTTSSAIPEVVGDAGLLCEPASVSPIAKQVCDLIENPELQHELSESGLTRVESKFTWNAATEQLIEHYRQTT
ncbi:glycosyltransferase family 4 protein [Haloferax elongans]|uniref:glycosyltransferase family 4 protein n=1 Tax=Haloferax elongans TaxID=403191 RepID=UPI000A00FA4B|nr:glycosyltransferase family 4 protein [Haloferax elongans]